MGERAPALRPEASRRRVLPLLLLLATVIQRAASREVGERGRYGSGTAALGRRWCPVLSPAKRVSLTCPRCPHQGPATAARPGALPREAVETKSVAMETEKPRPYFIHLLLQSQFLSRRPTSPHPPQKSLILKPEYFLSLLLRRSLRSRFGRGVAFNFSPRRYYRSSWGVSVVKSTESLPVSW